MISVYFISLISMVGIAFIGWIYYAIKKAAEDKFLNQQKDEAINDVLKTAKRNVERNNVPACDVNKRLLKTARTK